MLKQFQVGKMDVKVFEKRTEMGKVAAQETAEAIKKVIAEKGECYIIFAAAPSQDDLTAALVEDKSIDWSKVTAYHMDEYIGLDPEAPQGFGNYLKAKLFGQIPLKAVHYLKDITGEPEEVCEKYSALLKEHKPDIVCMGIGENGHIAFNDPHVAHFDDDKLVKIVDLDDTCRQQQVNDGCFKTFDDVPKYAYTLTIPALMLPEYVFCIVPAPTKANAVKATCQGIITEQVPATVLRIHDNAKLYVDSDAGKYVL